jgi:hypothetical protein
MIAPATASAAVAAADHSSVVRRTGVLEREVMGSSGSDRTAWGRRTATRAAAGRLEGDDEAGRDADEHEHDAGQ